MAYFLDANVFSIERVADEIEAGADDLAAWAPAATLSFDPAKKQVMKPLLAESDLGSP